MSRKNFRFRNALSFFVFFTMLFNGGMTASYIVWTRLFHIKNSLFAYLLPGALMGGMNVMLVRNYFNANIPYSIVEAARIDGASEWTIFWHIAMGLSTPILSVLALNTFTAAYGNFMMAFLLLNLRRE